jgi:fatty-acyl-CoA synthase
MIAEPSTAVHLRALDPFDFLTRAAFVYPERIAVIDGDARRTYPEFLDRVRRLASALQRAGIRNGERVAVLAPNTSMVLEATFAVPLAGGILCALNTRLAPEEIDYILGHCGAELLIHDAELDPLVDRLASKITRVRAAAPGTPRSVGGTEVYEDFIAADAVDLQPRAGDENDTISINYTSGTTGKPKGVMYTFRGAYLNALAEVFHAALRPDSAYLWTLPMFHCNGWCFPWAVTAAGATHVCLRKVDAPGINHAVHHEGVTHFNAAPTVLIALANHPETVTFPRRVIVTTAGAPPSPTTIEQIEALGAELHHVYGLTETYGPITECAWHTPAWDALPPAERARLRSRQGVPMVTLGPHDVRVVDPDLNDVPADGHTHGEIVMRGNNVMKGLLRGSRSDGARLRRRLVPLRRHRRPPLGRLHRDRRPRQRRHHQRRREHLDPAGRKGAARTRRRPRVRRRRDPRRQMGRSPQSVRHPQARPHAGRRNAAPLCPRTHRGVQSTEGVRVLRPPENFNGEDSKIRPARTRVEGSREARQLNSPLPTQRLGRSKRENLA